MIVRKNIKKVRKEKGLSQKQMAEKLNISISSYQKIEQNAMVLSMERFLDICAILEINSYNLLLPHRNAEIIDEVEKVLLKGSMALGNIRNNTKYGKELAKELIEKIKSDKISKEDIIEELEFIEGYFSITAKYSTTQGFELNSIRKLLDKID